MISQPYQQIQIAADDLARKAARVLATHQKKAKTVHLKDAVDLATTADLVSEKLAIREIQKKYPSHSIYSEEAGYVNRGNEYLWFIDPLDGTKEYARGLSEYNFLVAVEHNEALVVGVMYRNGLNEAYSCSLGSGATLNGEHIHVSSTSDLMKSFVGFHIPIFSTPKNQLEIALRVFDQCIYHSYRVRPFWDDAKSFGHVARGVLEAHIVPAGLKNEWHDMAPGILLVQEAGGIVTDWHGKLLQNHDISKGILASNGNVHVKLLELLNT